jgi:hypothetical protein
MSALGCTRKHASQPHDAGAPVRGIGQAGAATPGPYSRGSSRAPAQLTPTGDDLPGQGGREHRVLFDTGISPDGLIENMRRLALAARRRSDRAQPRPLRPHHRHGRADPDARQSQRPRSDPPRVLEPPATRFARPRAADAADDQPSQRIGGFRLSTSTRCRRRSRSSCAFSSPTRRARASASCLVLEAIERGSPATSSTLTTVPAGW